MCDDKESAEYNACCNFQGKPEGQDKKSHCYHSNSGDPQKARLYIKLQCQKKGTLASDIMMLYYKGVMSSPNVAQLYRMIVLHN